MYLSKSVSDWLFYLGCYKNPAHLSLVLVTVNSVVHFDISMEIYHVESYILFSSNHPMARVFAFLNCHQDQEILKL